MKQGQTSFYSTHGEKWACWAQFSSLKSHDHGRLQPCDPSGECPHPRDLPGIYFIIPKDACNINIYVQLGTPESWGTGAQLWGGWALMLRCAFYLTSQWVKDTTLAKPQPLINWRPKQDRDGEIPKGSTIKQTMGCFRKEININPAYC